MDLPVKIRSPPPKPPRRRHSDHLSVSSSGTFPSSKKKIADENHYCNDNKHSPEKSTSFSGSLPANWTPEYCLENSIENSPVFIVKECTNDKHPLSSVSSDNNSKSNLCVTKENQYLLQEIKSLKEINSKLWEQLCFVQASIESVKNCSSENSSVLSISDLLMSIYDSLKAKDSAMEDRMKIILEERDNAINDLDKMVQIIAKSFDDKYSYPEDKLSDEEIKELLKEIEVTSNPSKLLQQQRLLLSYLYRSKELQLDHMLHEMKLLSVERDSLKLKVQLLESELKHLKLSNEIWDTDNRQWESSLLNTLCQVIQQRDVASKSLNSNSVDYFNGSFRSFIRDKSLDSEEIGDCLQNLEGASVKKKIKAFSQNEIKKYTPLSAKSRPEDIKYLKEDMLMLNSLLEKERDKRKCTEERCVRLERLVSVLQKKLNGQNVGIPV